MGPVTKEPQLQLILIDFDQFFMQAQIPVQANLGLPVYDGSIFPRGAGWVASSFFAWLRIGTFEPCRPARQFMSDLVQTCCVGHLEPPVWKMTAKRFSIDQPK